MIHDSAALHVNLRQLCAQHHSVAEICRRIGINRQQFNKYLAGTLPSPRNLARISSFFGLDPGDLYLPPRDFAALAKVREGILLADMALNSSTRTRDPVAAAELERYCGVYQTYQHAPYAKSSILVGLCQIRRHGDHFLSKYVELTEDEASARMRRGIAKMYGVVTLEGGFVYILDRRISENSSYSLTVLFPHRGPKMRLVTGMTLSLSHHLGGSPYAANIVYEKLSSQTGVIAAARRMRLYDRNTTLVSDEVKHIIANRIREGQQVLSHYFI